MFVRRVRLDVRLALRRRLFWALLVLGLANLLAGSMFGLADVVPATRMALEVIEADFLLVAGLLMLYCSALSPLRGGWRLAAQVVAAALLAVGALTAAGLLGIAHQLVRGHHDLQLTLYASGLYFNLGWPLLHLLAMATFLRAVAGTWPGILAAVAIHAIARLAFEHPLLRFGAPISPWSDMNGYGPFLAEHVAAGVFWTAFGVLLLVAAHLLRRPRRAVQRRLTANVVSTAWAACVACAVTGLWVLLNARPVGAAERAVVLGSSPQPAYSRLELAVDVYPDERRLMSRGAAVVVNRHHVAIPRIQFTVPRPMVVDALSLTGELEQRHARSLVYRLNRPLEPKETLRVEFELAWLPDALPRDRVGTGVLANGTLVRAADIVPKIGQPDATVAVVFRASIGTALDQIAIAPGVRVRAWQEEGRSYFEYHAKQASMFAPIHSGRYAIAKDEWQGNLVEIYHHPAHLPNLGPLAAAAKAGVPMFAESAPAPLRLVEVPDYGRLSEGSWLLGRRKPNADPPASAVMGGVLSYSELDGFTR